MPGSGSSYHAQEDVIVVYWSTRGAKAKDIVEILKVKVGTNRTEGSIRRRVKRIREDLVGEGQDDPYELATEKWNLDLMDAFVKRKVGKDIILPLIAIDDKVANIIKTDREKLEGEHMTFRG